MPQPFHLALHVSDLNDARRFYGDLLGCAEGRSAPTWVDFDFFGHQLSLHQGSPVQTSQTGLVGDKAVPMPHFGVVLEMETFRALADRLSARGTVFLLPPQGRFLGQPGEQWTMFMADPAGNALEFKAYPDPAQTFASGAPDAQA